MTNKMHNLSTSENGENVAQNTDFEDKPQFNSHRKKPKQTRPQKPLDREVPATNLNQIFEVMLIILMKIISQLVTKLTNLSSFIMNDLNGHQFINLIGKWYAEYPYTSVCVVIGGCFIFLPFLLLMLFGLSTILMTLTGFLVLEGTLLTFLSILLIGFLGALVWVCLSFGILGAILYFGFSNVYGWYSERERIKLAFVNVMQNKRDGTTPLPRRLQIAQ